MNARRNWTDSETTRVRSAYKIRNIKFGCPEVKFRTSEGSPELQKAAQFSEGKSRISEGKSRTSEGKSRASVMHDWILRRQVWDFRRMSGTSEGRMSSDGINHHERPSIKRLIHTEVECFVFWEHKTAEIPFDSKENEVDKSELRAVCQTRRQKPEKQKQSSKRKKTKSAAV